MNLHLKPPLTPRGVLLQHPATIWVIAGTSMIVAVLAWFDGGSALLVVDEPVQRWVESHRSDGLTQAARLFSRLGSNVVVFSVFAFLVLWAYRHCHTLALTLCAAVLMKPPLEFMVKAIIDRDRPNLDRLIEGSGPSHPSGHVLAAVALWGLLPPLVSAFSKSRALWWVTVVLGGVLITGIAASRVYLGLHWFTDVVQGMLLGSLYLVALEELFAHHHHHRLCALSGGEPSRIRRSRLANPIT